MTEETTTSEAKHPMVVWAKAYLGAIEKLGVSPEFAMGMADDVVDLHLEKRPNSRYFFEYVKAENGVIYRGAATFKDES